MTVQGRADKRPQQIHYDRFWDHADALRGVLLRAAGVVVVLTALLFSVMPRLFRYIMTGHESTSASQNEEDTWIKNCDASFILTIVTEKSPAPSSP